MKYADILKLVGELLDKMNDSQLQTFQMELAAKLVTMSDTSEHGFNAAELALLGDAYKIKAIKIRRERTGESLGEVILAAKALYQARGWDWEKHHKI